MNIRKRVTADGSLTLYSERYCESYHSLYDGAVSETLQKHILPPIKFGSSLLRSKLKILDICFGLGYNTFFTLWYYQKMGYQGEIEIYSPEKDSSLIQSLANLQYPNEISVFGERKVQSIIVELFKKSFCQIGQNKIYLFLGDANQYLKRFENNTFDIIYQDAFSPDKNPELWSKEYFSSLLPLLKDDGMITTYSQKESIKELVKGYGLRVYEIPQEKGRNSRIFSKIPLNFEILKEK